MPHRKEVRWFTRGEFTTTALLPDTHADQSAKQNKMLGPESSIYSFTNAFDIATREISAHPDRIVTIDGGPHTLWW